jgi:hemerythrin-like domain-containing protein
MCEHCGCRGVEPIAELMDEHYQLQEEGQVVLRALRSADRASAEAALRGLATHLDRHVRREESGVFAALRRQAEFVDEVDQLEREHESFDAAITALDPDGPDYEDRVHDLIRDLDEHVERENLGIFPVSVVTLHAAGWELVDRARTDHPTFLAEKPPAGPEPPAPPDRTVRIEE